MPVKLPMMAQDTQDQVLQDTQALVANTRSSSSSKAMLPPVVVGMAVAINSHLNNLQDPWTPDMLALPRQAL